MEGASPPSYSPWMMDLCPAQNQKKSAKNGPLFFLWRFSVSPSPFLSVFFRLRHCDFIHSIFYRWIYSSVHCPEHFCDIAALHSYLPSAGERWTTVGLSAEVRGGWHCVCILNPHTNCSWQAGLAWLAPPRCVNECSFRYKRLLNALNVISFIAITL